MASGTLESLPRLRLLVELRRRGTVGAVAEALHFSPSTVSQQLSRLEQEVGARLLEPSGRRVRLTPQAEVLADHAERILASVAEAEAAVARSVSEVTGTVRIAAFQTGILRLVEPMIGRLAASHPGVRVEVVQAEPDVAIRSLLAHEADLALLEEYPHHAVRREEGIEVRELRTDPMLLALPVALVGDLRRSPTPAQLWQRVSRMGWAMEPEGSPARAWITDLCRQAGFEPDVRVSTEDLLIQRHLVASGRVVAILPSLLGPEDGCVLLPLPVAGAGRRLLTATRASPHPAVRTCREALAETAAAVAAPVRQGGGLRPRRVASRRTRPRSRRRRSANPPRPPWGW